MSASRDGVDIKDLLKDKKFLLIIAIFILVVLAVGGYFLFFNNANTAPDDATLPASGKAPGAPGIVGASGTRVAVAPAASGMPGVPPAGASPAAPGMTPMGVGAAPGMPGVPAMGAKPGGLGGKTAVAMVAPKDSFAGAPAGYGSGQSSAMGAIGAAGLGGQIDRKSVV